MKKTFKLIAIGALVVALVGCGMTALKTYEEPDYTVISSSGEKPIIEQRRYAPKLMAQVDVTGPRDEAINDGFKLLADFIFGNNTAQKSIDMTTPVAQQATSQTIDMTTPVAQQATGENSWQVRFFMPDEYTLETLPTPNNDQVKISVQPAYEAVVIRFSGRHSEENLAEHQAKLDAYIEQNKLQTIGAPAYAFYDPPWTPWFMKRNEIIYRLAADL